MEMSHKKLRDGSLITGRRFTCSGGDMYEVRDCKKWYASTRAGQREGGTASVFYFFCVCCTWSDLAFALRA